MLQDPRPMTYLLREPRCDTLSYKPGVSWNEPPSVPKRITHLCGPLPDMFKTSFRGQALSRPSNSPRESFARPLLNRRLRAAQRKWWTYKQSLDFVKVTPETYCQGHGHSMSTWSSMISFFQTWEPMLRETAWLRMSPDQANRSFAGTASCREPFPWSVPATTFALKYWGRRAILGKKLLATRDSNERGSRHFDGQ